MLVYAIVKAQTFGWGSGRTIGLLAAAVALLALFVWIERRAVAPLVRLSIFKVRTLAVADGVLLLVASGLFGMFFFFSLYVQQILGYSPLQAGLAALPVTFGIAIGAGVAQQLIRRLGVRGVSLLGIVLAAVGMAVLTQVPVHGTYVANLLPGLIPMSIGMGLTFVPITLLGTGGVGPEDAGLASGLFNTAQQVGGSLGPGDPLDGRGQPHHRPPAPRQLGSGRDGRPGVGIPRGVRSWDGDAHRRRGNPRPGIAPARSRGLRARARDAGAGPPGGSGHGRGRRA